MRQLNDKDVYIPLKKDPTASMIKKINAKINTFHCDGYISDSSLQYLLINSDEWAGRFYLFPKIHKKNCPGWLVISGCDTPTENCIPKTAFVDHQIRMAPAYANLFMHNLWYLRFPYT